MPLLVWPNRFRSVVLAWLCFWCGGWHLCLGRFWASILRPPPAPRHVRIWCTPISIAVRACELVTTGHGNVAQACPMPAYPCFLQFRLCCFRIPICLWGVRGYRRASLVRTLCRSFMRCVYACESPSSCPKGCASLAYCTMMLPHPGLDRGACAC